MAWDHAAFDAILIDLKRREAPYQIVPLPNYAQNFDFDGTPWKMRAVTYREGLNIFVVEEFLAVDDVRQTGLLTLAVAVYPQGDRPSIRRTVYGGGHCKYWNFPTDDNGRPYRLVYFMTNNGSFQVLLRQPTDEAWAASLK